MEAWRRVWIDARTYSQDIHSLINCTQCHGGQAVDDMELAHIGLIERPSQYIETCGSCHVDIAEPSMNSLHTTLEGYNTALHQRSIPEHHDTLDAMQVNHCVSCHTTCGDCHISQPFSVGGGLLRAHTYVRTPPMSQTCTACHGSRVKDEYFGAHEDIPSDVHFRARMGCADCHTGNEIHGIGMDAAHRYDGPQGPNCIDCHQDQVGVGSGIEQHEIHGTEILSCQSCHSLQYTNCVNCHVAKTDAGVPYFSVEDHYLSFMLGLNPIRNAYRPYRFVTLRHAPVDPTSFDFYGDNLLPNFDNRPTWGYATPHNIQRRTPQTATCEACHGNAAIFLTEDKVLPHLRDANASVIVERVPPLPEGYVPQAQEDTPTQPPAGEDDFWGGGTTPPPPPAQDDFWGDGGNATATPPPAQDDFWGNGGSTTPTPTPTPDDFWGG